MLETTNSQYKSVKILLHQADIAYFYRNGYSKDIIDGIFDIVKKTKIDKQVVGVLLKLNYGVNRVLKQMIVDETKFLDDAVQNGICKPHKILMTERLYCVLNGIHEIPLCRVCRNPLKNFIINRTNDIHYVVCSKICSNRDAEKIEKRIIKYMSRSPEEKLKTKLQTQQTIEQRFGNKCFMKTEYFKKKQLEYIIENGGECNVSQIKAVRDKVDETNIDRYGNRCNLANEQQKEMKRQTYIAQYYRLLEKTKLCEQKGIHLIHVYESEWIYHQDGIKRLLIQLISGDIVFPDEDVILLPYDKYSRFMKIDGYELKDITCPELICHYGMKKKLYHVYDCGQLVFKRIK